MNHRTRRMVETIACERRYGIADAKGAEYSGKGSTYKETGADTLHNFKSVAERIGGTPEQVLMTYLLKHIDSINTTVREAAKAHPVRSEYPPGHPRHHSTSGQIYASGEGIVSRLDDARNYLDLLECLLIDNGHIGSPVEGEYEYHVASQDVPWREPTRTSVGEDDPGGLDNPTESPDFQPEITQDMVDEANEWILKNVPSVGVNQDNVPEGMIRGFDGVVRPKASRDESVRGDQVQTPICESKPTLDHLRYGETGEL